MVQRVQRFGAAAILVIAPIMSLLMPGVAHAAGSFVWQGGGSDNHWSTAANWVGGVAPQNNDVGDNITIDNSATFTSSQTVDDVTGLSLGSLTFTNDSGSSANIAIVLNQALTVTGPISQNSSDTTTTDFIENNGSAKVITLGADVTVTASAGLNLGSSGQADNIALAGHTLTFTDTNSNTANITAVDDNLTGSGTVVYNGPATDYQINGANTYTGTTHVIATNLPLSTSNNQAFGTSSITVETGGAIDFDFDTTTSITNPITVTGTPTDGSITSLGFQTLGTGVTLSVPNITLNGDTRFANNGTSSTLVVDLAGITANGHCVEYLGYSPDTNVTDGPSNGFRNGPAGCQVASTGAATPAVAAPAAPNTGLAAIVGNPITVLAATIAASGALLVIARQLKPASRSSK